MAVGGNVANSPDAQLSVEPLVAEFERLYSFPLDPFQLEAISALSAGRSVLVTAPTATGKTVVAEYSIWSALRAGRSAIYTTPIKALSNQKYRDLRRAYGAETVGLLTGDIVENPAGRVLVMTTEVLRNMLLQDARTVEHVGTVIFDEIHYLADPERGTTWEEALIICPPTVRLVCLSATVGNVDEFAGWLASLRPPGDLLHVECHRRAVPLEHRYLVDGEMVPFLDAEGRVLRRLRVGGELRSRVATPGLPFERGRSGGEVKQVPAPPEVVRLLSRDDLLPAIYFLFSRRATEESAELCGGMGRVAAAGEIGAAFGEIVSGLPREDRQLSQVERLGRLLPRGIAFHHAGMLPALKMLVEDLLVRGLLRVVFATDTLSLGINAPARSVVLGDLTKYDGVSRRLLTANEYRQLTGRAGRRGLDAKGVAVTLYSPWVEFQHLLRAARGPLEPLESAFRPGYNTAANLWLQGDAERRLAQLAGHSLRRYQRHGDIARLSEDREQLAREMEDALAAGPRGRPKKRARTLAAALAALDADLDKARNEAGTGGRRLIRALRSVLERYGYLRRGEAEPRLERLARLFDANALTLAEMVGREWLRGLRPAEIAEVASWFAGDRDDAGRTVVLPRHLMRLREQVIALHAEVMELERRQGINLSRPLPLDLAGPVLAWAQGASLEECCRRARLGEGDFIQLVQKTIDLLGQLRQAAGIDPSPVAEELGHQLADAATLIRRGIVAHTYAMVVGHPVADDDPEKVAIDANVDRPASDLR